MLDFLHSPFRSIEDPLDVLFLRSGVVAIEPFSVGISVGSAKSLAAASILHVVTSTEFTNPELQCIAPELLAICVMKATTDPANDVFSQVLKTIGKKIRVSDRARPHPAQMEFAFVRACKDKQAKGDKRKSITILGAVIQAYNKSQPQRSRLNSDERAAVMMLHDQEQEFKDLLKAHWRNYPVLNSAVPVSYLALPWLVSGYEPGIKKATNPIHYQIQSPDIKKNTAWLQCTIGKYQHKLGESVSLGKTVNLRSHGQIMRHGNDKDEFFYAIGMFLHFKSAIQKRTGLLAFSELLQKFFRGALERELVEKVKAKDPQLSIDDFRFVQAAMDYDPQAALPKAPRTQEAMEDKQSSEFKLDTILLKAEQEHWADYIRQLRAFNADLHTQKVAHLEVGSVVVFEWAMGDVSECLGGPVCSR